MMRRNGLRDCKCLGISLSSSILDNTILISESGNCWVFCGERERERGRERLLRQRESHEDLLLWAFHYSYLPVE